MAVLGRPFTTLISMGTWLSLMRRLTQFSLQLSILDCVRTEGCLPCLQAHIAFSDACLVLNKELVVQQTCQQYGVRCTSYCMYVSTYGVHTYIYVPHLGPQWSDFSVLTSTAHLHPLLCDSTKD